MTADDKASRPRTVDERRDEPSEKQRLADIRTRIEAIREGRGYVLPSHAMLAAGDPDLLVKYEEVYRAITYKFNVLSPFEKNFIWLVVVACVQTPTGSHHLKDFISAHGTIRQAEAASCLAMIAIGSILLDVIATGWQDAAPGYSPQAAYQGSIERIVTGLNLPDGLVDMALAAGQACRGAWDKVVLHIRCAKKAGVTDEALAEALTVVILPAGNPAFVQASTIWRDLIRNDEVDASPAYRYASTAI